MVIEITLTAIREEGKIVGVRGLTRYTGGRREAQRFLTRHEERFRKVVQTGMDAIALYAADGTCRYISDAVEDMLGYHPDELIGLRWESFAHPDDRSMVAARLASLVEEPGHIEKAQCRARHRDGSWRWIEIAGSNQLHETEIDALIINFRDITERKLAQEALEDSEQRLKELFENMRSCAAIYTVEAMGSYRAYRPFLGIDAALEEITANRGVTFDPQAVDTCVALFREKDYRLPDE
jgi:PAS domain S-box-containing protein